MDDKRGGINILPNEATRLCKNFLYSYGKGRTTAEQLVAGLLKILKENSANKYLVHVELYMHINDPNVEEIYENDEIPFEFIPYNYPGISKEFYCKLIIQLELHNQFLQMVSVMKSKKFFQNLITAVVSDLFSEDNIARSSESEEVHLGAPIEIWRLYLINIAKYSKDNDASINQIYTILFKKLLDKFLCSIFSKQEKLSMILRIAGIACMKKADYEGNTEITELNRDWAYDNTENLAKKSRETFSILYPKQELQSAEEPTSKSVLDLIIDLLTNSDTFVVNEADKTKWSTIYRTNHLTWMSYIGACSYLTQMILVKYSNEIGDSSTVLINSISGLVAFKPKMAEEDFHGEIVNFDQFCELLSAYGDRERYQRKWFQEFLNFPESLLTVNGVQLAVKLVSVAADFDIALGLVNKALELNARLNERIKSMIINMLSANKNVKARKQEFVMEVFKNGVHSLFAKDEFVMDFNMLCTKLGTIEQENDPKMQSYWEDIVYSICFQNPMVAAEGILKQSMRIHQFKTLRISKPFLAFETEEILTDKLSKVPIFQTCLFNIIHATEEYDPLFDHMVEAVPALIENDFIDLWTFHEFLIHVMGHVIVKRKMAKLFKLVLMYEQLLEYGIKENKLAGNSRISVNFLDSLRIFTYAQAKCGTLSAMIKIRDKVYELKTLIQEKVQKSLTPAEDFELTEELEKEYGMLSLVEFGALYSRNKLYRKSIKAFFQDPENFTPMTFAQLLKTVVSLIFNSSNSEWEAVIEYFMQVLLQSRPEFKNLSPLYVINESAYFALAESKKNSVLFQRFLDFYSYFVRKLQSSPTLMAPLEQKSTINCLAGVSVAMYEISKAKKDSKFCDTNVLRHILLMMLSLVDWMVVHNEEFDQIKKDLLIMVSSMRMPQSGPCIPIQRSIISRIVQKKDAPLITLQHTDNAEHDPQLSAKIFKNYVSMKSNQVPEEMLQLEKDWDSRDTFEYCPRQSN